MKPCPYCAELIQELAAKCRYCGEWLDPSKRPAWSGNDEHRPASPVAQPAPTAVDQAPPVRTTQAFAPPAPDTTTTDGSLMQPMRSWSTPPWLAGADGEQPDQGTDGTDGTADRASLEEVALRMEKIKRSAAAVRDAVERAAPRGENARTRGPQVVEAAGSTQLAPQPAAPAPFPAESRPSPTDPMLADGLGDAERQTLLLDPNEGARAHAAADTLGNIDPSRPLAEGLLREDVLIDHAIDARHEQPTALPPEPQYEPAIAAPTPAHSPGGQRAAGFEDQFLGDLDAEAPGDDDDFGGDDYGSDDYGDDDLGDDDFGDDDFGDDDFGSMSAAPAPMPWKPILAGAGVLVVVGLVLFSDAIFGGGADSTGDAGTTGLAAAESGDAPDQVAGGPAADGGQPVQPEPTPPPAAAPAAVGEPPPAADGAPPPPAGEGTPPEGGATPVPTPAPAVDGAEPPVPDSAPPSLPPAAPLDESALAQLDEARGLWQGAKGRNKGKLKRARGILEGLLSVNGGHPETLLVMAQVQLELGATKEALETARKCTQASAELADCWLTTGFLEQDAKNRAGAKEAYEKYLQLAPDGKYAGDVKKLLSGLK